MASCLKIWFQFRCHLGSLEPSVGALLAANHNFSPSLQDSISSVWARLGIRDLYVDCLFASFQQLTDTYKLPNILFFRHLQVRRFVYTTFSGFQAIPNPRL